MLILWHKGQVSTCGGVKNDPFSFETHFHDVDCNSDLNIFLFYEVFNAFRLSVDDSFVIILFLCFSFKPLLGTPLVMTLTGIQIPDEC